VEPVPEAPPKDENYITEDQLRKMEMDEVVQLCADSGVQIPEGLDTKDAIVDWLLTQFS
jgi:hypothetical protein